MTLEAALEANTAALRELITKLGNAQPDAPWPFPGGPAPAGSLAAEHEAKKSGEASASTPKKSSDAPKLAAWHKKTAAAFAELKDSEPTLESVRKAILAINREVGREQADAVLGRFGANAVTAKPEAGKTGLDPEQYPDFFAMCLDVLAGKADATASMETA